jgi:hypothetical protein
LPKIQTPTHNHFGVCLRAGICILFPSGRVIETKFYLTGRVEPGPGFVKTRSRRETFWVQSNTSHS